MKIYYERNKIASPSLFGEELGWGHQKLHESSIDMVLSWS